MSLSGWIVGLSALVLMGGSAEAGRLEPPGPPAPTMKSLDEIPSWSQALPANDTGDPCNSSRFKCVLQTVAQLEGAAVLDRETGLVWERTPSAGLFDWNDAQSHCNELIVGNRMGWRLPTVQELTSLAEPTGPLGLPSGHPFSSAPVTGAWSATTRANNATCGWNVIFAFPGNLGTCSLKINPDRTWCVRGGQGVDPQ